MNEDSEEMKKAMKDIAASIIEGMEETIGQWYRGEIDDYEVIHRYGKKVDPGISDNNQIEKALERINKAVELIQRAEPTPPSGISGTMTMKTEDHYAAGLHLMYARSHLYVLENRNNLHDE